MKPAILAFIPIALLTAIAPAHGQDVTFSFEERLQGEATIQSAAKFFARSLREPSSATFRNVFMGKRPPPSKSLKIIVCGEVNGKNGHGGYTGFQPFIASGNDVYVGRVAGLSVVETCYNQRVFDETDYAPELSAAAKALP